MEDFVVKIGIKIRCFQNKDPLFFTHHKPQQIAEVLNYSLRNLYTSFSKLGISVNEEKQFEFINYIYNLEEFNLNQILKDLQITEKTLLKKLNDTFGIKNFKELEKIFKETNDEIWFRGFV